MHQVRVDGVIPVPRRRREAPRGLVERERQGQFRARLAGPVHAGLPLHRTRTVSTNAERSQDLETRVPRVDDQRHGGLVDERYRQVEMPAAQDGEQLA